MINVNTELKIVTKVRGNDFPVNLGNLPQAALDKIFAYGAQRLFNDSAANAKTDAEAIALATKKLDALISGQMRSSTTREGNPVKREAMKIALAKVQKAPKFIAWLASEKLKPSSKRAIEEMHEHAKKFAVEGTPIWAQAEANVAALAGLEIEIDL